MGSRFALLVLSGSTAQNVCIGKRFNILRGAYQQRIYTLRQRQNGCLLADSNFKWVFMEIIGLSFQFQLNLFPGFQSTTVSQHWYRYNKEIRTEKVAYFNNAFNP